MLVVENNSVYEIDEECLKRRSVPEECEVYQKIVREREAAKNKKKTENKNDFIEVDKNLLPEEWKEENQLEIDTANQVKI